MNEEMSSIYMASVSSGYTHKTYIVFDFDRETAKERAEGKFRSDVQYMPTQVHAWKIGEVYEYLEVDPYEIHGPLEVRE